MDYVGLALFSVVGTQVAGDAGFNLVGCTLVGCVAGLGGRTINNLLFGATRNGVFWARNSCRCSISQLSTVLLVGKLCRIGSLSVVLYFPCSTITYRSLIWRRFWL